ncbi:hypothetical protein Tco_1519895, partial [Tanacetum coccineum]
ITKPKVVHVRQWKPTGRIFPLGEQCPVTRSIASTSACRIDRPVIFGLKPRSLKKRKVYASVRFIFGGGEIFLFKTILINKLHAFPSLCCHQVDQRTFDCSLIHLNGNTASDHISLGPTPNLLMLGPISSGLVPNSATAIPYVPPINKELEMLFQQMFDEYFDTPPICQLVPPALAVHDLSPSLHQGVLVDHTLAVNPFSPVDNVPFVNIFSPDPSSEATSSGEVSLADPNQSILPHEHLRKWNLRNPLDRYVPVNNLLPMPCGVSIILYYQKSKQKTSNLLLLKIVGLRRYKMKSMNLIAFKYGN